MKQTLARKNNFKASPAWSNPNLNPKAVCNFSADNEKLEQQIMRLPVAVQSKKLTCDIERWETR